MTPSYSAHALPPQNQDWHTYPIEQTLALLETDPETGLTEADIIQRLAHYGVNEIQEVARRSNWDILLDQFKNVMLLMLIAVAIISGILDIVTLRTTGMTKEGIPFKDTIAIFTIVILNGFLGYFQESRAEKALSALKRLSSPKVQVIRQGDRQEVEAPQLVPGDIILIEAGTQLSADAQIIEAANLQVRESALTGEAHAVEKQALAPDLDRDLALGDRVSLVFTGTEVLQGRAKAVVTRTGMETELGKIAQMLQSVQDEPTPLQQRMTQLGNVLVTGSMILVLLVVGGGVLRSGWGMVRELIEISLSMAVAVVPEGLPAVITVTLAIGTQRMVRRHALIRKLPAVETLGSVDVICSDKTGTLTQNKMIVQEIITLDHQYQVTGDGYDPQGELRDEQQQIITPESDRSLSTLLLGAMLCNDSQLTFSENQWLIMGDPTEGSLIVLGSKAGIDPASLKQQWQRLSEIPFSSERKRMSVVCRSQEADDPPTHPFTLWSKGSPELLLEQCRDYQGQDNPLPLTDGLRQQIAQDNNALAERGLRVLGLAYKVLDASWQEPLIPAQEQDLVWLGLVGMLDAPRVEVKVAVAKCRSAGIRPIMITGDHQLTAQTIAQQLGISQAGDHVLTGRELEVMTQETLEQEVKSVSVYARVSPEHKLRIVQALQKQGKFVAMTGDGVNDAPALKQANIGIAMGITGTDVSKEASDMVLLDDNFATIVAATEEGRVVYSNIRHFIKYILGSNIGEVITIAAAPILGLSGIPLTPLQILWMNLVTDGLPALALAVEPADPDVMNYPPLSPKESIFARGLGAYIVRIGIVFAVISITLMVWAFNESKTTGNPDSWKTMVFTTLCLAQMGHAIAVRSNHQLTIEMNPMTNPYLWGAVVVTTLLQLMLIYVTPLRQFFDTELLTARQLLICLGFSSLMFIWVEMEKVVGRVYRRLRSR